MSSLLSIKDFYEYEELIAITKELIELLNKNRTFDWYQKESAQTGMYRLVKRFLKKHKYQFEVMNKAIKSLNKPM